MALKTRRDLFGLETGIVTERLYPTSKLVSSITGHFVQRNKAIIGKNAFAHEAGIHQDGMLKHRGTYEIMRPEDVGIHRTELVLGKHSGRAALKDRIAALGHHLTDEQIAKVFEEFKRLCDAKKEIFDADVEALVASHLGEGTAPGVWELVDLHATAGTAAHPSATLTLKGADGKLVRASQFGDGPVDAIYHALGKITGVALKVTDYQVHSVSVGNDAMAEVTVQVEHDAHNFRARAVDVDTVNATARAFVNVLNKVVSVAREKGET